MDGVTASLIVIGYRFLAPFAILRWPLAGIPGWRRSGAPLGTPACTAPTWRRSLAAPPCRAGPARYRRTAGRGACSTWRLPPGTPGSPGLRMTWLARMA